MRIVRDGDGWKARDWWVASEAQSKSAMDDLHVSFMVGLGSVVGCGEATNELAGGRPAGVPRRRYDYIERSSKRYA